MRSVPVCRITAHLLIAGAHEAGEGGNMVEGMVELMSTVSKMIEEIAGNRRCGSGCGRLGAGEQRREDTRQNRYGVWDRTEQAISEREQWRIGSGICEVRRTE